MKLLDLFCGAGGCSVGYSLAGFTEIVGVDNRPQPRYPFAFIQADALEYLARLIETGEVEEYQLIHASPPCQVYSASAPLSNGNHPDLVPETQRLLKLSGRPYVIENVPGAPLDNPLVLCGTMFGLGVLRHRLFECNPPIWFPPAACNHWGKVAPVFRSTSDSVAQYDFMVVAGNFPNVAKARKAMGINWMVRDELAQAIPPAYTRYIGEQMARQVLR